MKNESILSVKDLSVSFHMYEKGLEQYDLKVISNMTLDVRPGEIVAIAGSSGSGKSLLAHAVMGLLPENAAISGEISYKGKVLSQKDKEKLRGKERGPKRNFQTISVRRKNREAVSVSAFRRNGQAGIGVYSRAKRGRSDYCR